MRIRQSPLRVLNQGGISCRDSGGRQRTDIYGGGIPALDRSRGYGCRLRRGLSFLRPVTSLDRVDQSFCAARTFVCA